MPDTSLRFRPSRRVAILVSRYNELITAKLLDGALACCAESGVPAEEVDVVWLPGAFELPPGTTLPEPGETGQEAGS